MHSLQLTIGNKNYSSWSMRPWVLMKQVGIPFEERMLRFDGFGPDSQFKKALAGINPAGQVPVLRERRPDGDLIVRDTLAIAEFLAETFPELGLWPVSRDDRARARCACAEMHAGLRSLRQHFPMNIEASLPEIGKRVLAERPEAGDDLARITSMWDELLDASGGPMLFGDFCIADAYFAPVAMRVRTYGLPVPPAITDYIARLCELPGVAEWIRDALAEQDFLAFEEPYRDRRS